VQYFFETLQNDHAKDEPALNEARVIKAASASAKLPTHVQDRFANLAEALAAESKNAGPSKTLRQ
jgi:hypothetical protein